jgi:uncharacterized protein
MAEYEIIRHTAAESFLDRAQPWLVEHEAENNLILSIAAQLVKTPRDDAYLATIESHGEVVGCAFRTPPYKLSVTTMPADAIDVFVHHICEEFDDTPGVLGPDDVARRIAEGIAAQQGRKAHAGMKSRIYQARTVFPPATLPGGRMRLAQPGDAELLSAWLDEFAKETNHGPGDARTYTHLHIANKTVFIWDDDGPKTTALWAGITPNGVRVGFVFTPAEHRGRGYASAVTAAASQRALDTGYQFCCLYTDLGNPTSNAIYQKIGYTPVCDVADYIIS